MSDLLPIVTDRNKLRKRCETVTSERGREIGSLLVEQLKLRSKEAVGLAAPQVGIDARVFAMRDGDEYKFFVNPEILTKTTPLTFEDEQCLSLPGKSITTIRYNTIYAEDDSDKNIVMTGFSAVVFQHEYDHLYGVLMSDREPKLYDPCFCGSGKKFKFCHKDK
jgi:peptide deformylase